MVFFLILLLSLKTLAVTTSARVPELPEVPTIAKSGVPGFEAVGWSEK